MDVTINIIHNFKKKVHMQIGDHFQPICTNSLKVLVYKIQLALNCIINVKISGTKIIQAATVIHKTVMYKNKHQ